MSLDVFGFIDPVLESRPDGGVFLVPGHEGGYTGPGGTWESSVPEPIQLKLVHIAAASKKDVEWVGGGVGEPRDLKVVHINDGTMIYPDDDGRYSAMLRFTDGLAMRWWRVINADCRPWRNFCRVLVERSRDEPR
ncbi:hypothetical protein BN2364_4050 [Alloalcanivorax xenomutans]|uniref:hypothetical protein n=1 Tax=Alloalcanivorax xenomutans TaxID=1094342 RepID=UPI0006D5B89F|nr:hypothetical protein [Alloalcanivorax xenomutans]CUR48491.1 hypothetical protein BN2364_4050 [Alloalcanivorax xenomutans]